MKKYHVSLDTQPMSCKPATRDGGATNRMAKNIVEVTQEELAMKIADGYAWSGSTFNGLRRITHFIQGQVIALDFDNEYPKNHAKAGQRFPERGESPEFTYLSMEKALQSKLVTTNASFVYKTFSYSPKHEKFRIVFFLNDSITNSKQIEAIYKTLAQEFPQIDGVTGQANRLYYAGTDIQEVKFGNELNVESLLEGKNFDVEEEERVKQEVGKSKQLDLLNEAEMKTVPAYSLSNHKLFKEPTQANLDLLKERLSWIGSDKTFSDEQSAINYILTIDMRDILGLPDSTVFHDLFRTDHNPSTSIFKHTETGTWLYKDHGTGYCRDVVGVVQRLLSASNKKKYGYVEARRILVYITDCYITLTPEIEQIRNNATIFQSILLSGTFKEQFPDAQRVLGRYVNEVNSLIEIMKNHYYVDDNTGDVRLITFMSVENISARLQVGKDKASNILNLMSLLKMTEKLSDTNIPSNLLEKLEQNKEMFTTRSGEVKQRGTARQYRSNVIELGNLDADYVNIELNNLCSLLIEKGFTMKGLSKEWVYRTFGKKKADEIFPQDKERVPNKTSDEFVYYTEVTILNMIQENGYAVINDVKDFMKDYYGTANWTDYKYKQAEAEIMDKYALTKTRLNKTLKLRFGVADASSTSAPSILIQAD